MKSKSKQDIARSITNRLGQIARNKNIPYRYILTEFLIERMVARLVKNSLLKERLIFKGGYVGLRIFDSPRYTIDLDALVKNANPEEIKNIAKDAMKADLNDGAWFAYEKEMDLETLGEYPGLRLYFRSGLGEELKNIKKAQAIHLDFGFGDPVVPKPQNNTLKSILGNESISWQVYTLESAAAEKLHTLITRHSDNSRAKDVYDLSIYLPKCERDVFLQAVSATFDSRGNKLPSDILKAIKSIDADLLQRGWLSAIGSISKKISIDEAFETILKSCSKLFSNKK